jgi:transposase-like protein
MKAKISEANCGQNNGMFGKSHSDETKEKQSIKQKERIRKPCSEELKQKLKEMHKGRPKQEKLPFELMNKIIEMYNTKQYSKTTLANVLNIKYNTVCYVIRNKDKKPNKIKIERIYKIPSNILEILNNFFKDKEKPIFDKLNNKIKQIILDLYKIHSVNPKAISIYLNIPIETVRYVCSTYYETGIFFDEEALNEKLKLKETIKDLYLNKNKSIKEICNELNMKYYMVTNILKRNILKTNKLPKIL